jgi:hypothetical protein
MGSRIQSPLIIEYARTRAQAVVCTEELEVMQKGER